MDIMRFSGIMLALAFSWLPLFSCGHPARRSIGDHGSLAVFITHQNDGSARVVERLTLNARSLDRALLSRNFHRRNTSPLTRQDISGVRILDASENPVRWTRRDYGEWINLDIHAPADATMLELSYTVTPLFADGKTLDFMVAGFSWNLHLTSLTVDYQSSMAPVVGDHRIDVDFLECEDCRFLQHPGGFILSRDSGLLAGETLRIRGKLPRRTRTPGIGSAIFLQNRLGTAVLAFFLLTSLAGLFLSVTGKNRLVRFQNLALLGAMTALVVRTNQYWWTERLVRGGESSSALGEFTWGFSTLLLVAAFTGTLNRHLKNWKEEAWFLQFGLFLVSAALLLIPDTNAWFLLLSALCPLMYWSRKSTATGFGAGLYRVVEHVRTLGEVSLPKAAKWFGLPPGHLLFLLRRKTRMGVVVDLPGNRLLSSENAALLQDFSVCMHCGAAGTVSTGAGRAACAFCGREYAASFSERITRRPVPVLIQTCATFFRVLAGVTVGMGAALGLTFFTIGLAEGDGVAGSAGIALITAGVFVLTGWGLSVFSLRLEEGRGLGLLRFLLILSGILVFPLVLLWKLRSRRIRLHFGRLDLAGLENRLREKAMPLAELAAFLETTEPDAADTAAYLGGNHLIHAVYDQHRLQLVHTDMLQDLHARGSCCLSCGGTLGTLNGTVRCQYCGSSPAYSAVRCQVSVTPGYGRPGRDPAELPAGPGESGCDRPRTTA